MTNCIYNYPPLDRTPLEHLSNESKMHQVIYSHFDKMNPLRVSIYTDGILSFRKLPTNNRNRLSLSTSP